MFPKFLPSDIRCLSESLSINFAEKIEQHQIFTTLSENPIASTYVHQGTGGSPLLLLHGFDSSVFEFRRIFPFLAEEQETYAVDLLGFGFTDRTAGTPFNPKAIKTHLYCFWKTVIHQPVILVGGSMGGAAAIDFTLTYPDAVEKLVLIDSAGFTKASVMGQFMPPNLLFTATEFLRNPFIRLNFIQFFYKNPTLFTADDLICSELPLKMPGWHQAMVEFTQSGGYSFFSDRLFTKIHQPTLILWGDSDYIMPPDDARQFARMIPESQLVWIPNCGHVPHLEKPQMTADWILDFCEFL
jgi:pimeloyl-ACP methyl ester carboxylesterase